MSYKHLTEYLTAGTIMANGGIVQVPKCALGDS